MKKTLLILCYFVFSFAFSQINSQVTPLSVCDTNNDGYALFDLTTKIPEILGNLNPNTNIVSFHSTLMNAEANVNVIPNPGSFFTTSQFSLTIYVRVDDTNTNLYSITSFNLLVTSPANAGTDGQITVCETDASVLDLHSLISGEQPGGIWVRTAGVGGTFSAVSGTYTPSIGATTSIFEYLVTGTSPCANDTSIATITVVNQNNCTAGNCQTPGNLSVSSTNFSSANLSWTETGSATNWEILVLPCGAPSPSATSSGFVTSSTNPFVFTGLNQETCYSFYVRSVCTSQNKSNWSIPTNFTTLPFPASCGGFFLDNGGMNSNYLDNSDTTTTICPTTTGDVVTISFNSFNTEVGWDALYVFDGNSAASPQLASQNASGNVPGGLVGGFWGSTIPGPFTSSSPDGCLTFRFRSDSANNLSGWTSNVICGPPDECVVPANLAASNITSTSAVLSWSDFGFSNSYEIYIVPFGGPIPNQNTVGIVSQSNPYVISNLTPGMCYSVYVRMGCSLSTAIFSNWSQSISFCAIDCTNSGQCPSSLSLVAFLDSNNNGIKESDESAFNNGNFLYTINNSTNQFFGYTDNGSYSIFDNDPTNVYNFSFLLNPTISGYYSSSTTYSNVAVVPNSGVTTYYFPITVLQTYNDLEVQLIPNNNPNPGFVYANTLVYKNNGTQTINSGTVTFTKDNQVTINYVSQSGTTTLPNGFSYNFTNLAPFEQRSIYIQMQVPTIPTISLGTLLTNSGSITSADSDAVPTNNLSTVTQAVVGSYDPNDKTESHGEKIVVSNFSPSDYLTYTIRFENMGTANTQFIRVEDFLHSSLNINSVEVLNASHPFNFTRENNILVWNFYNINLTPTSVNSELSHGFVQFRVKPNAGYSVGTIIPNSAEIYFDYNPPIFTNTFNTQFVQSLSTSDFGSSNFTLYPNPANDYVTIKTSNATENIKAIAIYDCVGKIIKSVSDINTAETTIDCSTFSKGIYLIEVTNTQNLKKVEKLILN